MDNNVVAVVAGKEITWADFDEFLQNVPKEQRAYLSNPNAKEFYLQQMIALYLFAQLGEDEKLYESEEYEAIMKKARRDVLSQMAMKKVLGGITATEDEKLVYYEAHKQSFAKGAMAHAKHILVDSEEKCRNILGEIQAGSKSFEDAAKEYSTCPSGQRGGDLGQFGKGQMVKEFEDASFEG
ncbi:MAG: peptidylprolyl isomerase, partial [Lachnospiraceae bacterium]|nr:peptidylprolyl isomerase [Lachnospiraceae bacterium]